MVNMTKEMQSIEKKLNIMLSNLIDIYMKKSNASFEFILSDVTRAVVSIQENDLQPIQIISSKIGQYLIAISSTISKFEHVPPSYSGVTKMIENCLENLKNKIVKKLTTYEVSFLNQFSKPQADVFRIKKRMEQIKNVKLEESQLVESPEKLISQWNIPITSNQKPSQPLDNTRKQAQMEEEEPSQMDIEQDSSMKENSQIMSNSQKEKQNLTLESKEKSSSQRSLKTNSSQRETTNHKTGTSSIEKNFIVKKEAISKGKIKNLKTRKTPGYLQRQWLDRLWDQI